MLHGITICEEHVFVAAWADFYPNAGDSERVLGQLKEHLCEKGDTNRTIPGTALYYKIFTDSRKKMSLVVFYKIDLKKQLLTLISADKF